MKRLPLLLTLFLAVVLLLFYILDFKPLVLLELKTVDVRFRIRGSVKPPSQIVLVTVDEKSLDEEGRWPWSRKKIARLISLLSESKVIAVDLGFFEPTKDDRLLALSIKRAPVVLGYFFHMKRLPISPRDQLDTKVLAKAQYSIVQLDTDPERTPLIKAFYPELGVKPLTESAHKLGYFNIFRDLDGVVRTYPIAIFWRGTVFAPLAVQTFAVAKDDESFIMVNEAGVEDVGVADLSFPVTYDGRLFINYYGPPKSFPYVSASDVLKGRVKSSFFKGKIVILGATAMGLFDNHVAPFSRVYPGPEIHATVVGNFLERRFLKPLPWSVFITTALVAIFCLMNYVLVWSLSAAVAALFDVSVLFLYALFTVLLFKRGFLANFTYPTLSVVLAYLVNFVLKHTEEVKRKKSIKQAFSHYLHPELVEEIEKEPEKLKLGGEKRLVTVLFSDIRSFTTISEGMDPEVLVELLNDFFSAMTEIVIHNQGYVDKFIGDCVMAVFNAPVIVEGHPLLAVRAAISMVKKAQQLSEKWEEKSGHPLVIGVGINTGYALVGNIGSKERLNYTVLGDTVNLASRLEGQCKTYSVRIVASEFTIGSLPENADVQFRKLDFIRVKGKHEPVVIYEVFTERVDPKIVELYEEGLLLYKDRRWKEAMDVFEKILEKRPQDGPSLVMFKRCSDYLKNPPPEDWDGVYVSTTK